MLEGEKYRKLKRENDVEELNVAPVELLTFALESLPLEMKRNWSEITRDQIQLINVAIAKCSNAIADSELEL